MAAERHFSAAQAAWVMVATSVSLNDAFISAWGYKFRLNLIRPRTFIRETMDSTWEPAIPTPAVSRVSLGAFGDLCRGAQARRLHRLEGAGAPQAEAALLAFFRPSGPKSAFTVGRGLLERVVVRSTRRMVQMRNGSKKPVVEPPPGSAGVSKGRRVNVRAPSRLDERPARPEPNAAPTPTPKRKPNGDDVARKR
jgi:hypothetical protein